jgi:hypothetical protein
VWAFHSSVSTSWKVFATASEGRFCNYFNTC